MPKKKVTVTYLCEICSSEHKDRKGALDCEKRGIAIPEFHRYEVVKLANLPNDMIKTFSGLLKINANDVSCIVHDDARCGDEDLNPHLLPLCYEIWIPTPDRSRKRELASVSRENLRKVTVKDKTSCPVCKGRAETIKDFYNQTFFIEAELPFLNIPMQKCLKCGERFFTTRQLGRVKLAIKKDNKWLWADIRRLIRNYQFQY